MRVLVAGSGGQLGRALAATAPAGVVLIAPPEAEFDIANPDVVAAVVADAKADLLVNAAAWTAVDKAEAEEDAALRINATAVAFLATEAARTGTRFVQISTDYVFDGCGHSPYAPDTVPAPASAYGRTKLAGEQAAQAHHPAALIIRTAWVYAAQGNNFVRTMLRLMAERDEVRVVADQIGTPTHAASLARAIWALDGHAGLFHWTDAGVASWYDFAVAIQEEALRLGLLTRQVPVLPIATSDYPTPAQRPAYSVLDKSSSTAITGPARHWRSELIDCLKDMRA
jgi:dTDP-4-dehydrorhamnose reductase